MICYLHTNWRGPIALCVDAHSKDPADRDM